MASCSSCKSYPKTIEECSVQREPMFGGHAPVKCVMMESRKQYVAFILFEPMLSRMEVVIDLTRDDNPIQRIEIVGEPHSLPRALSSWRSRHNY
jgi:hypothetical protein